MTNTDAIANEPVEVDVPKSDPQTDLELCEKLSKSLLELPPSYVKTSMLACVRGLVAEIIARTAVAAWYDEHPDFAQEKTD